MRLLFAIATGSSLATAVVFLACGAPSSFEHLVGGPEAGAPEVVVPPPVGDPTLKPPRQVAPLAGSYVDSLRPHFRWELQPEAIGATIDICDAQDCSGAKKTFTATGSEFTPSEDIPAGRYFWRLASTTAATFGTKPGPAWPLLVRGGAGLGDARGRIADFNGDGIADLITTTTSPAGQGVGAFTSPTVIRGADLKDPTLFSTKDYSVYAQSFFSVSTAATYDVIDVTGDGLSDIIIGDTLAASGGNPARNYVELLLGSSKVEDLGINGTLTTTTVPPLDNQPAIASGGDLDGDGYGDIIVSQRTFAFAMYGSPVGLSVTNFFDNIDPNPPPDAGELPPPTNPLSIFGFDQNADGIGDILEGSSFTATPLLILAGKADRTLTDTQIAVTNMPIVDRANAFAGADVDNDGKPDVGFLTNGPGKPSVCVLLGSVDITTANVTCLSPAAAAAGFGSSIVAADVDADGKDELLVGTTGGGVDIVSFANNALTAEHLGVAYGDRLTVLFPGRPGPAVWVATRSDGASLAIYRGKDQAGTLMPPQGTTMFNAGIR